MIYKQGKSFPATGLGAGLIFAVLAVLFAMLFPGQYWYYPGFYFSAWILFSTTTLDTKFIKTGYILKRVGFFPFKFTRHIDMSQYDAAIIKKVNVKYSTTHSTGAFVINTAVAHDSFMALNLKFKGKYEMEVLFKGSRKEIEQFIKDNLLETDLRFFNGALEKELEINYKTNFS